MDNSQMTFRVFSGDDSESHWHPEVEVLYVIDGSVTVWLSDMQIVLPAEELLVINACTEHKITPHQSSVICLASFPGQSISEALGAKEFSFSCCSVGQHRPEYRKLRELFKSLIYNYAQHPKTKFLQNSLLLNILDILVENFLVSGANSGGSDAQFRQMVQYINQNYRDNLSLSQMAEDLFVSPSTLSRFFKKNAGMNFMEYVTQVRMHAAVEALVNTDTNVTRIAADHGFSTASAFNRLFRKTYGVTPRQYRQTHSSRPNGADLQMKPDELRVLLESRHFSHKDHFSAVTVDTEQGQSFRPNWNVMINYCYVDQLNDANMQSQLLYLQSELGFTYARVWHPFSRLLQITDSYHPGGYNFTQIDSAFDFLVDHHIYPCLEFGKFFRPHAPDSGSSELTALDGIDFPSRESWENFLHAILAHFVTRYGVSEVNHWMFDISFFSVESLLRKQIVPWASSTFDAYRFIYQTVKHYAPNAQVGRCDASAEQNADMYSAFLSDCIAHNCVPDFCSAALFPYELESMESGPRGRRSTDPLCEEKRIARIHRIMNTSGAAAQGCKLYVAEWNFTASSRNYLNDSCYRSAYMARKLVSNIGQADIICIHMGSDRCDNSSDRHTLVSGSCGLLTTNGLRKPAFYALRMLNALGNTLLYKDDNCIITRTRQDHYQVLCFHVGSLGPAYYFHDETEVTPDTLQSLFFNPDPITLSIELKNVPDHAKFAVKRQILRESDSILTLWKQFDYGNNLSRSDIEYIQNSCVPRLSVEQIRTSGHSIRIEQTVGLNEVILMEIYPV